MYFMMGKGGEAGDKPKMHLNREGEMTYMTQYLMQDYNIKLSMGKRLRNR